MQENEKLKTASEEKFTIYDAWERFGVTKHWGAITATRQLIELCNILPGQYILDIGCGTGYTTCLLAKDYQVNVAAADIRSKVLEEAKRRIVRESVGDRVKTIKADAHELPFQANTFDAVIAESVLAFCNKAKVAREVYRVLKPDGVFGDNEGTYLKPPPAQLSSFLSEWVDFQLLQENEWRAVYTGAGFEVISSTAYPFEYVKQFLGEIRADGIRRRLSAWLEALFDPTVRRTILTATDRDTRQQLRQFLSHVGYGLYVGRKVR